MTWVLCKKRYIKRSRIIHNPIITEKHKRKLDKIDDNIDIKKQRIIHCLIHDHKYICDMYDCNGVKDYTNKSNYIPYII